MKEQFRKMAVFGAADGVAAVIGLVALIGQPHALFRAAVGVALAEFVGMSAGAWLSADEDTGLGPALVNGGAAFAAIILAALSFEFLRGWPAVAVALGVILATGALIAWLRTERGWPAVAKTYGVLVVAAVVCVGAALL